MSARRTPARVVLTQAEADILKQVATSAHDDPDRDMRDRGWTGAQRNALGRALDKLALARAFARSRDTDDWPLPAVEVEQAEAVGLVVQPTSPAAEQDSEATS